MNISFNFHLQFASKPTSLTLRARELRFWDKVHLPLPTPLSCVTWHVSHDTWHMSCVTCHMLEQWGAMCNKPQHKVPLFTPTMNGRAHWVARWLSYYHHPCCHIHWLGFIGFHGGERSRLIHDNWLQCTALGVGGHFTWISQKPQFT